MTVITICAYHMSDIDKDKFTSWNIFKLQNMYTSYLYKCRLLILWYYYLRIIPDFEPEDKLTGIYYTLGCYNDNRQSRSYLIETHYCVFN